MSEILGEIVQMDATTLTVGSFASSLGPQVQLTLPNGHYGQLDRDGVEILRDVLTKWLRMHPPRRSA